MTYTSMQRYAKGYPGLRQLEVLRDYGKNSIVASICPKITDPSNPAHGYVPAIDALVERLSHVLQASCLPRAIAIDDNGTPETSDDYALCVVLEARLVDGKACTCDETRGRVSLSEIQGGAEIDEAIESQLVKDGHCGGSSGVSCASYCICLVNEYQGAEREACLEDVEFEPIDGWCYVDPLEPPAGQSIGNPAIVASCAWSEKRTLRFAPAPGAIAYVACQGVSSSTSPVDGG